MELKKIIRLSPRLQLIFKKIIQHIQKQNKSNVGAPLPAEERVALCGNTSSDLHVIYTSLLYSCH